MRSLQFGLATALAAATCCLNGVSAAEGCIPFMARQALDKVLRDSSQIFGIHGGSVDDDSSGTIPSKPAVNDSPTANWMSRHPDSTPLQHLTIPGTHDSATWNFSAATRDSLAQNGNIASRDTRYFRSQRHSLRASLDAGIRFFDLRYSLDPVGTVSAQGPTQQQLLFWHHEALLSQRASYEHIFLFALPRWLAEHPGETVLVSLMAEGGTTAPRNDQVAQRLLFDILTSEAAKRFIHQSKGLPSSLGEARGKIVLVRRFQLDRLAPEFDAALPGVHLPGSKWGDNERGIEIVYDAAAGGSGKGNGSAFVEDYYELDVPRSANASVNIAEKLRVAEAHLRKAAGVDGDAGVNGTVSEEHRDGLFFTFCSAEHSAADVPVFYEIMANGNGTAYTPDGGVNHQLVPIVKGLLGGGERKRRLGVVIVDYYDEPSELVPAILGM